MKILLVDHEATRMRSIRTILASLGHKASNVESVESGAEAFHNLKRKRVDCVIIALGAPGLDGMSFLTKVRESASLGKMPVILLETAPSRETILEAGKVKASGFLVHPCSIEDVEAALANATGKK